MMKFILLVVCVTVALALEPINKFDDESAVKSFPTDNIANSPTTDDIQTADTKHKKYGHRYPPSPYGYV